MEEVAVMAVAVVEVAAAGVIKFSRRAVLKGGWSEYSKKTHLTMAYY